MKQTVQVNETNGQVGTGTLTTKEWGDAQAFGSAAAAGVGAGVKAIVTLSQAEYDAIAVPDPLVLYLIPEA